jgi:hypothetical protein
MLYAECPSEELSRAVVLGNRPVEGDTVNELINNQTLLLKEYTGWPGPFTSEVAGPGGRLRLE